MLDLSKRPFIIFWELTRACKLACKHCRAKAQRERHPDELSFEETKRVIEQIKAFGKPYPLVVITGGDPLLREDVFDIVKYGVSNGLRIAMAFSGTDLATLEVLESLKEAGVSRIAISIDGSNESIHDGFRGVKGTFRESMKILKNTRKVGISTQINTTVTKFNLHDLANIAKLAIENKVTLWDVFFVVPTGRAKIEYMPSSQEFEDILNWLYDVSKKTGLNVKSSAATHLRRIELQRDAGMEMKVSELYYELLHQIDGLEAELKSESAGSIIAGGHGKSLADGIKRMMGITDGRGMFFISHVGEVYPSGFLPLVAGNVRKTDLKEIYNESQIFKDLKDPDKLKGKCGRCEHRRICGGSRARAYAVTSDYLAQEPRCIYTPKSC
ncbi:radical SAM/SPASM domain-containing protein [Archaeoglobales archaeon]|nr:MAG: radical SAM/SPASM domain-containing protein [Archaeoglobales archaeon]